MAVSLVITRGHLGLPDLELNDYDSYYVSATLFGGATSYERNVASSPYAHGDITVSSRMPNISETVAVEVLGTTTTDAQSKVVALLAAFAQPTYSLVLDFDGAVTQYECERADHQVSWNRERLHNNQPMVTFQVPRQPIATQGY